MIISRYITREVIHALLAITIVLLLAFLCQQIVRYLNYVAIGKIPTSILLQLVSFEIPYLLAFLLPLGLYISILLVYGRLYADHEMSILQLYGYQQKHLLKLTASLAFVIAVMVSFLMLWLNPILSAKRQRLMASDEATMHLVQTMLPGRFQVSPDGRHVMYVEKLSRDRARAQHVFLAQERKNPEPGAQNTWMLVFAKEGFQTTDHRSQDPLFVMTDGHRYEGIPGHNDYKITQFKRYTIRILQNNIHITHQEDETLSMSQLWQDYQNPKRAAELQWRFSIAISAFLLAMLAVPLSIVHPKQGRYVALLPAILLYIIYVDLMFIARHWVEQGRVPIGFGMWWVHGALFIFAGMIMMMRRKK